MIDTSLQNLLDHLIEIFLTVPHSNITRFNGSPVELSLSLMERTLESAFLTRATLLIELGQHLLVEEPFPDDFVNSFLGDDTLLGKMRLSKRTTNE